MRFKTPIILWALLVVLFAVVTLRAQDQSSCPVKVSLLQVNDVYQFSPVEGGARGGLGRLMTLRKLVQRESPNTVLLLAGDTISPSVESIIYKGAQMIDAWNLIGLDYATFGNHEFDFGPDVLRERMQESRFKWIASNVIDKNTGKPFGNAASYVVREFDGVKVGIFGLVLPDTKVTSRPGPDIEFLSPCETARKIVKELHEQGVKTIVALTHLSMREDKEVARCANVDVVIGGHEHTLLESFAGGAPIFKMTADAREMGQINLNINKESGEVESIDWRVIPVTSEIQEDPEFAAIYTKYGALLRELSRVIGRTSVTLDARSDAARQQETNVGNLITDAFRQATLADVALMNGGSIRADGIIQPGPITVRDVVSILPFKNRVIKLQITGAVLRAALEHGVARSAEDAQPGRFPQVSGFQFSFDATRSPGSRIVSLTLKGKPLDDNALYTLATTEFIALQGGDGYDMFKQARLLSPPEQAKTDSEILNAAIAARPTIAPKVEGRIKRLDAVAKDRHCPH